MGQYWSQLFSHGSPIFVSLGMIVLDEVHFPQDKSLYDVPGGSGLYGLAVPLRKSCRFTQTNGPQQLLEPGPCSQRALRVE
jgi:hypothetical protein